MLTRHWVPCGHAVVPLHRCPSIQAMGSTGPLQWNCPSMEATQVVPSQSAHSIPPAVHDRVQVPLGRHSCPPGHGQVMVWLQLLRREPQPGAQVVAWGWGTHPGGGGGDTGDVVRQGLVVQVPA
jgi:hypothetical protein